MKRLNPSAKSTMHDGGQTVLEQECSDERNCLDDTVRIAPHGLEHTVQRKLLAHPKLQFASLVIRRIPNGVCLEGVLESGSNADVASIVRDIAGVDRVLNHLVVHCASVEN